MALRCPGATSILPVPSLALTERFMPPTGRTVSPQHWIKNTLWPRPSRFPEAMFMLRATAVSTQHCTGKTEHRWCWVVAGHMLLRLRTKDSRGLDTPADG